MVALGGLKRRLLIVALSRSSRERVGGGSFFLGNRILPERRKTLTDFD